MRRRVPLLSLLCLHWVMLAWGAWRHSPTVDEFLYLTAGVSHWQLGRFDLCRVSPPLVRLVAALPVVACQPATDWSMYPTQEPSPNFRSDLLVSVDFVEANGSRSFLYVSLARFACIPFSILGAWVCYRWARDLFGESAGMLAAALWCLSPNIMAHAQLVTPDCGATSLGVVAAYCQWRWLSQPGWRRALIAGGALGLVELTRSTWIILFALWPIVWATWHWTSIRRSTTDCLRSFGQLLIIVSVGLYVLNLGYLFDGTFRPLGKYEFTSNALAGSASDDKVPGNRFRSEPLGTLPLPLPVDYLQGIDLQKGDFEKKSPSYLRGEWQLGGWWYYYIYALLVKVPVGTLLLFVLGLVSAFLHPGYRTSWRCEFVLVLPAFCVLLLVSSQTGLNEHMRYVLGGFPFAFVWSSRIARSIALGHRTLARIALAAFTWSAASSLSIYPHCLSYFNESAGGPTQGGAHLVNSNIDWGQDLFYLKRWLEGRQGDGPLRLAYFPGTIDPELAGIHYNRPPVDARFNRLRGIEEQEVGPQPGWYALSINALHAYDGRYSYFGEFEPVSRIGYSIVIYRITPEDVRITRPTLGPFPGP